MMVNEVYRDLMLMRDYDQRKIEIQRRALERYQKFIESTDKLEQLVKQNKVVLQDDYIVETVETEDLKDFDDIAKFINKDATEKQVNRNSSANNETMDIDGLGSAGDSVELSDDEPNFEFGEQPPKKIVSKMNIKFVALAALVYSQSKGGQNQSNAPSQQSATQAQPNQTQSGSQPTQTNLAPPVVIHAPKVTFAQTTMTTNGLAVPTGDYPTSSAEIMQSSLWSLFLLLL
ncbi:hypothetical protein HK103_003972 [Boothiomyces macroporosus]|uniref:Uncharacterized protein n=1 Tax=Boothiomyces macroporosus TaxID=261099 RepID=A0AAD5Y4D3_9FUNG|nr:hypothetical protein HK103_003972 [Boothiomyces macroporosus]